MTLEETHVRLPFLFYLFFSGETSDKQESLFATYNCITGEEEQLYTIVSVSNPPSPVAVTWNGPEVLYLTAAGVGLFPLGSITKPVCLTKACGA